MGVQPCQCALNDPHQHNVIDSTFAYNTVEGLGSGGGAIYTERDMVWSSLTFTDNRVDGNMAAGGAVWVHSGTSLSAHHINITGNSAIGYATEGGALIAGPDTTISLRGAVLHGNMVLGMGSKGEQHCCFGDITMRGLHMLYRVAFGLQESPGHSRSDHHDRLL
jgi:predicted outer membrane repeat protein